ncbi:MAG TPA: restriction endonuclease subunit S, partial [Candidatus Hydrogenedentes bacterium]|nr:restriction endonuclease subunit S [Candidatus Hydrogenedentota bacterium]
MAGEWQDCALADLIDVKHGFAFQGRFISDEACGDILLTPGNFSVGGGFKGEKFKYYNGPVPDDFVLNAGDLLVSMTDLSKQSDTLGYPAFVPHRTCDRQYLHNQRLGKVLLRNADTLDLRYLYYRLCAADYRHEVLASATGTTVKHTSPERIRRFRFSLPPLPEQRAIAQILGTLDDKIEVNRRMNGTLEGMARALFQSWFVDFDPVRAKAEGRDPGLPKNIAELFPDGFEDSELGEIPRGWGVGRVDEEFDLTMGQSPPGYTYNETGEGLPFYQGRADFTFRFPMRRVYCTAPTRFAKQGDTLVSVRAPVGDINMAGEECAIGRGVAAVRHKSGSRSFTYYSMRSFEAAFAQFEAEGTVFGSISKRDFHNLPFIAPHEGLVAAFERLCGPLDAAIARNAHESRTLASLRDALLPKLVSGELRVGDA